MAPNATRTTRCKAWNSPVEYPSRECKHDVKEFGGNIFNSILKENVHGRKHPGSYAFTEPELLSYGKPKHEVQNENNAHNNPTNSHNYHDANHDEIELYQGNSKMTHKTRTARTPKLSYRLWWDAVDQCTMSHFTYIHIMKILNYTSEMYIWNQTAKNNSIISSNTPSWPHQRMYVS